MPSMTSVDSGAHPRLRGRAELGIGLEAQVLFRVTTAASPSRLIVDFASD